MDRNTWRKDGVCIPLKVAAGVVIYAGHMVAINATGFAVPADSGAEGDSSAVIGVAKECIDNSTGADGAQVVLVHRGCAFFLVNSTATPVTQALIRHACKVEDSVTVCADDTLPRTAGTVIDVSPDGVWVFIS